MINIQQYTSYNLWANSLFVDTLRKLDDSVIDQEIVSSFSSVRKTVHHIRDAEALWLLRLNGTSLSTFPPRGENYLDDLIQSSQEMHDYALAKTADELQEICSYTNIKGEPFSNPRHEIIMHCMNHSTFHRGQLVTLLRQCSVSAIPSTDLITYLRSL